MSVKITESRYLNGMPNLDYSITINGVRISLTKEDFAELTKEIGEAVSRDYLKAKEVKDKYDFNIEKIQELRKDIISVFWDGDQDDFDSMFFKKTVDEIDQDRLFDVLKKHNNFLGFE